MKIRIINRPAGLKYSCMGQATFTVDLERPYADAEKGAYTYARIFEEFGFRGTFYVSPDVLRGYPGLVIELSERGHEIGSHGTEHPYSTSIPGKRSPFLTELDSYTLTDQLSYVLEKFKNIDIDVQGFRAMWFRIDERVLKEVGKLFSYDSSLIKWQMGKIQLPDNLKELPVSTFKGTSIRVGTPVLFGPTATMIYPILNSLTESRPLVLYGHSFDFIKCNQRFYNHYIKRFWYYNRCGPERIRDLRRMLDALLHKGLKFYPAKELIEN